MPDLKSLKIVHVTRAPVGGIFRHILDVASGQAARGHHVGIVCDSTTGGARAEAALAAIAPQMKLGIARFAMQRELGPADLMGFRAGIAASRGAAGRAVADDADVMTARGLAARDIEDMPENAADRRSIRTCCTDTAPRAAPSCQAASEYLLWPVGWVEFLRS
jgi:hypothetical protein